MFILDLWGDIRSIFFWIEGAGFAFIDNAYRVFISLAKGNLFDPNIVKHILSRMYIVVGIFALFRIALLLVNSIINPDNFNKEKAGVSKIFINTVIMLVLLVMVPTIFSWSRDLTSVIVDNNLIQKVFNNSGSTGEDVNPGYEMQRIALGAIIKINDNIEWKANKDGYVEPGNSSDCPSCDSGNDNDDYKAINCVLALQDGKVDGNANKNSGDTEGNLCLMSGKDKYGNSIEGKVNWSAVSDHNGNYTKKDGGKTYIYESPAFLILATGIFITYVLLSFSFDIAKRMLELAVLEILSPLFIATYVDPKSAESGPFKKWLTACGKSYASLFVRLAVIALMLLSISLIRKIKWPNGLGFFGGLILLIAILIFFKQAPKWISGLIGLDGDDAGLGGLGIGKKIGGAALIGGAVGKGMDFAKKKGQDFAKRKGKNFLNRRAAGIGARINSGKQNKQQNPDMTFAQRARAARLAAKANNAKMKKQQKEEAPRLFEGAKDAYAQGAKMVNPDYKTGREKAVDKLEAKASGRLNAAIKEGDTLMNPFMDSALQAERAKELKAQKIAKIYSDTGQLAMDNQNRLQVTLPNGEKVYANPEGDKEFNQTIGYAQNENDAYRNYGMATALSKKDSSGNPIYEYDKTTGRIVNKSTGAAMSDADLIKMGNESLSYEARLKIKEMVTSNVAKEISEYKTNVEMLAQSRQQYNAAQSQLVEVESKLTSAQSVVGRYTTDQVTNMESRIQQLNSEKSSKGFLTASQESELQQLQSEFQNYTTNKQVVDSIQSQYDTEQMKAQINDSKKKIAEYEKAVKEAEDKFEHTTVNSYGDDGRPDGKTENPYEFKINGKSYNPKDNYTQIDAIITQANTKASKAKDKSDKALEAALETGKDKK